MASFTAIATHDVMCGAESAVRSGADINEHWAGVLAVRVVCVKS